MKYLAVADAALFGRHAPLLGSGHHQHFAGRCGGLSERIKQASDARASAGDLSAKCRVDKLLSRRPVFKADVFPVHFEFVSDDAVQIEDPEIVRTTYGLLREEGFFPGATSGTNVAAAIRVARDLGPGHTIVTILCDGGHKYASRFYNREWLETKGLLQYAG